MVTWFRLKSMSWCTWIPSPELSKHQNSWIDYQSNKSEHRFCWNTSMSLIFSPVKWPFLIICIKNANTFARSINQCGKGHVCCVTIDSIRILIRCRWKDDDDVLGRMNKMTSRYRTKNKRNQQMSFKTRRFSFAKYFLWNT